MNRNTARISDRKQTKNENLKKNRNSCEKNRNGRKRKGKSGKRNETEEKKGRVLEKKRRGKNNSMTDLYDRASR